MAADETPVPPPEIITITPAPQPAPAPAAVQGDSTATAVSEPAPVTPPAPTPVAVTPPAPPAPKPPAPKPAPVTPPVAPEPLFRPDPKPTPPKAEPTLCEALHSVFDRCLKGYPFDVQLSGATSAQATNLVLRLQKVLSELEDLTGFGATVTPEQKAVMAELRKELNQHFANKAIEEIESLIAKAKGNE